MTVKDGEDPYARIVVAIRSHGFFAGMQPLGTDGEVRLVCASDGGSWGLGGVSFWVTLKRGCWLIATWVPHIYRVPSDVEIIEVVIASITAALRGPTRDYYVIDPEVVSSFDLEEITIAQFNGTE